MTNVKNLPLELKTKGKFCVWKYEENEGRTTKVPYNPKTNGGAMSNNAATFTSLEIAEKVQTSYDGIGLGIFNGYCAIDLDYCIDENGVFDDRSKDIITIMTTYTEYSPSGKGLRLIFKASDFPYSEDEYKQKYYINKRDKDNPKKGIEVYVEGITNKYVTVTGNTVTLGINPEERSKQLQLVLDKYMKRKEPKNQSEQQLNMPSNIGGRLNDGLRNDKVLIELWNGNRRSSDESGNDEALMNKLAYWCDCNINLMVEVFKNSPHAQQKTNPKHIHKTYEREDYLIRTAQEAVNKCHRTATQDYEDYKARNNKTTPSAATPGAVQKQENILNTLYPTELDAQPDLVSKYLDSVLIKDIERFKSFKDRKTGFKNLDALAGGLYPGLYVIGAISSLGKTTFAHQMGDQLASMGDHVLFFSLEQNRLEMVTKSLSRITAQNNKSTAVSAIKIRGGKLTSEVIQAAEEYNNIADHISVIECNFETNIYSIMGYTKEYIKNNKVKPIVIVDYLQIIAPIDPRQSDKEKVDSIVRGLKKLQSENDLVVFVISSINRANYLTPIDFESFKESGGIEYTADVVWGLQLQILNDELFNSEKKVKEKREKVRIAKKSIPRDIELVCLKNRYGVSSYSCGFKYDPCFDLFEPDYSYKAYEDFNITEANAKKR